MRVVSNIAAFTSPSGSYPPYISINRREDGMVEITLRAEPSLQPHPEYPQGVLTPGHHATIALTPVQFADLLLAAAKNVRT